MNSEQVSISIILLAALLLFAWGRWRYDLVAMFCLIASVLLGVVPEKEAFHGFGHPAVVTVAAVLILSQGLQNAGVVALLVFIAAIVLAMTNIVTLPVAFILAVMVYVLSGIIRVREIYEQVDWAVIVLLAAMIPVGHALETTQTTLLLANTLLNTLGTDSPVLVLTLVLIITMLLSSVVNNAATALIMAPIAVATAQTMQVNIDAYLMAVAIGASCAFLTPVGHQSNTLVMGPGGYQFGDYWRMGLPLEIIIVAISVPLILWAWPL